MMQGALLATFWPSAAWYAYCIVHDEWNRSVGLNKKLQDYAVNNGIVFG